MRNKYNLSHLAHIVGHIGRIQTISVIPVIAGDSLSINIDGIMRLAPTRKEIVSECQVDILAFHVPHRHVFGWEDEWKELVIEGLQWNNNLDAGAAVAAGERDCFFLGIRECGATINRALIYGYNTIYQRYFMVPSSNASPSLTVGSTAVMTYPGGMTSEAVNSRKFGYLAARLPHILNDFVNLGGGNAQGYTRDYTQGDWGVEIDQDNPVPGTALLDIRDLKQIQSRYSSIQEQNYFAQFYNDVLGTKWNSHVNTDADQRPTYLGRQTMFLSGSDVNGTDDATLGSYIGKTLDRIGFNMQRRYFAEHGNVWLMMVPRFPLVHTKEQHPLLATAVPDNTLILGDPRVWAGQPVVAFNPGDWMAGGSAYTPDIQAQHPYGQEYRYQPNRVHPVFETIPGYPFTSWDTTVPNDWYYYTDNEYVDTFQTSQLAQWQAHMSVSVQKFSSIVDPKTSIFAGA